jgi:uncharacterized membrane protein YfcA
MNPLEEKTLYSSISKLELRSVKKDRKTMISPYFILLFVTISSFVYGLIGFGDALILIPIITPIIGIQSAIVLTNFWGIFTSGFNLIQYRKFIDWKFVGKYLLVAVPAAIIGIFLIPYISGRILEIILGVFIGISAVKLIPEKGYRIFIIASTIIAALFLFY